VVNKVAEIGEDEEGTRRPRAAGKAFGDARPKLGEGGRYKAQEEKSKFNPDRYRDKFQIQNKFQKSTGLIARCS
jgi:hypothetical protein